MTRIALQANTDRLPQQPIGLVQTIHECFGRSWRLISYSVQETGNFFEKICKTSQPPLTAPESSNIYSTTEGQPSSLPSSVHQLAMSPGLIPLLHKSFQLTWRTISFIINQNQRILERINGATKPLLHQPEEQPQLNQPLPIISRPSSTDPLTNSGNTDPIDSITQPPLPKGIPQPLTNTDPQPLPKPTQEEQSSKPSTDPSPLSPLPSSPVIVPPPLSLLSTPPSTISRSTSETGSIDNGTPVQSEEWNYENDLDSVSSFEDEEEDEEDGYNFDKLSSDIFSFLLQEILEQDSSLSLNDFLKTGIIWDAEGKKQIRTPLEQLNGTFTIVWPNKCIYRGKIKNGKLNGKGYISLIDNGKELLAVDGKFEDNILRQGFFNEGNRLFEGKFIQGYATGSGSIKYWNSKEISQSFDLEYKGEFRKGRPHGRGKFLELVDGNIEVKMAGFFDRGNLKEGFLRLRDGRVCKGQFNNGIFRKGIISDPRNNSIYEGEVENNNPHGLGKIESSHIFECDGESVQLTIKASGRFIEGKFVEGEENFIWEGQQKSGHLMVSLNTNEDQELIINEEEDNILTRTFTFSPPPKEMKDIAFLNGKGTIRLTTLNCIYEGQIQNGVPDGQGKLINYEAREIIEGSFEQGCSSGPATITNMDTKEVKKGYYDENEDFIETD
ncbi:hypothetical protein [Candidatus Protochlamydia phocaeensis]|uniref:hypothetical protein n=1 Tax=Candidatus Protochlamydia phocaeensis TaxID=1414722 RepID=UPI000837D968|nr:hypothetical protein [Candidatus Protochlamydia phocaeensis]